MPKISILATVYNEEKYIRESIESALKQSFGDFEFVIVDDGSTDGTLSIIKNYAIRDARIKIVENKKNLGRQKSLNIGLKKSIGQYVACLDGDDIWNDKDKLKKQVNFLEQHPYHALVGTAAIFIDESGQEIVRAEYQSADEDIRKNLLISNQFAHSSVLIRKKTLDEIGFYSENKKHRNVEDYELWLRLGKKYKLANLSDYSLEYRFNPKGISLKNQFRQKLAGLKLSVEYAKYYPNGFMAIPIKLLALSFPGSSLNLMKKNGFLQKIYSKILGIRKQ